MTEKELDLIREGNNPIRYGEDGLPEAFHEPIFERMRFFLAVCKGYNKLHTKMKLYRKWQGGKK